MAYEAFKPMIHFFGDEAYKVISGNDFMKEFKSELGEQDQKQYPTRTTPGEP